MSKYLRKDMYGEERALLTDAGYVRRYSRSRSWLDNSQLISYGAYHELWQQHMWQPGHAADDDPSVVRAEDHELLTPVGRDLVEPFRQRALARKIRGGIDSVLDSS